MKFLLNILKTVVIISCIYITAFLAGTGVGLAT